jgi:hypothetical protein
MKNKNYFNLKIISALTMYLTQFICHSKGQVHHISVSTKRNIFKLDQPLLKKLNLENIYTQKIVSKVKLTKQDGTFEDNEIFQNFTTKF